MPAGSGKWSHVGVKLNTVPTGRKLTFSCLIKGSADDHWSDPMLLDKDKWKTFQTEYVAPENPASFTLWVIDSVEKSCYVSKASLIAGGEQNEQTEVGKAEVISAHAQAQVKPLEGADMGIVSFPIPGEYREQIPLTFNVATSPQSALVNYSIHKRDDGRNWLCEVTVRPPSSGATVGRDSLVLVKPRKEPALAKAMPASSPESEP